jgi:protein PhnA
MRVVPSPIGLAMSTFPSCPQCGLDDTYPDGAQFVCPHCAHQWVAGEEAGNEPGEQPVVRDCNGNPLAQGDSVVVIKDLKVRGSSIPLKQGTLIRNIRLVADDAEHIEGNSEKIKGLVLKTCFLRKA